MRISVLLVVVALLPSTWLAAQYETSGPPATTGTQAGTSVIEGCLSGSDNNFTLTDRSGTKYQLVGDNAQLTKHAGEEVRLTGTAPSSAKANPDSTVAHTGIPNTATGKTTQASTFGVMQVKKLSSSCSTGAK
jgi:hypothetical protein